MIDNTVTSGAGTSDHFGIQYKFEGQELQSFAKGNSAAQPMTVTWYSKTTKPGVYTVELDDRDNTRSISAQFTATTAWTRHSVTFPGDTTGALDNDTLASVHLSWWLMAGSSFTSGTLQTAWDARTNTNRVSSTNINLSDNDQNNFYITGVQLEMGNTATPFEHRPIGMELSLCQRYYEVIDTYYPIGVYTSGVGARFYLQHIKYATEKRAQPDVTITANNSYWTIPGIAGVSASGAHVFTAQGANKMGHGAYSNRPSGNNTPANNYTYIYEDTVTHKAEAEL